jgi:hypothetical protein
MSFDRLGATVRCEALCLNCGMLIPHRPGEHVVMAFRPGVGESPDYVVALDDVEVHRCRGPVTSDAESRRAATGRAG